MVMATIATWNTHYPNSIVPPKPASWLLKDLTSMNQQIMKLINVMRGEYLRVWGGHWDLAVLSQHTTCTWTVSSLVCPSLGSMIKLHGIQEHLVVTVFHLHGAGVFQATASIFKVFCGIPKTVVMAIVQVVPKIICEGTTKAPPGRPVADAAAGAASQVKGATHVCRVGLVGWRCAAAGRWWAGVREPVGSGVYGMWRVTICQRFCDGGATCCPKWDSELRQGQHRKLTEQSVKSYCTLNTRLIYVCKCKDNKDKSYLKAEAPFLCSLWILFCTSCLSPWVTDSAGFNSGIKRYSSISQIENVHLKILHLKCLLIKGGEIKISDNCKNTNFSQLFIKTT